MTNAGKTGLSLIAVFGVSVMLASTAVFYGSGERIEVADQSASHAPAQTIRPQARPVPVPDDGATALGSADADMPPTDVPPTEVPLTEVALIAGTDESGDNGAVLPLTGVELTNAIRPQPRPSERFVPVVVEDPVPLIDIGPIGLTGLTEDEAAKMAAEGPKVAAMMAEVRGDDWDKARSLAAGIGPVAKDIVEWRYLRAGLGTFDEMRRFLARRHDWPGLARIRYRGEGAIPLEGRKAEVLGHFRTSKPRTGVGALAYVNALKADGRDDAAKAEVIRAWTTLSVDAATEALFLRDWSDTLAPHHAARLDNLLWLGLRNEADRMIVRVDEGQQRLARARMVLRARGNGVDAAIDAVPNALKNTAGLAYERFRWRMAKGLRADAVKLILKQSASAEGLGRPELWARQRRDLARRAMRAGDEETAYRLASEHWLSDGQHYADLEWLAGYLALRFRRDPGSARQHFANFRTAVFTPISLGRAGYWEGRAEEALGNEVAAKAAYARGGVWQSGFYGQLAAEKAGIEMRAELPGTGGPGDWRKASFADSSVVRAAQLFIAADEHQLAAQFLSHLVESLDARDAAILGDLALEHGAPHAALKLAKEAAQRGIVLPRAYFPVVDLGVDSLPVDRALALSIARRESEFNPGVSSGAGARGLMQLMPATARNVARSLGLPYSKSRLLTDPVYNARLGSAYLADLERRFGKNVALVSAGYNAGPGRPERWMRDRGDPRRDTIDAVDWIEMIPFDETRNYVMRVAESVPMYRARLSGKVGPLNTGALLKAR